MLTVSECIKTKVSSTSQMEQNIRIERKLGSVREIGRVEGG